LNWASREEAIMEIDAFGDFFGQRTEVAFCRKLAAGARLLGKALPPMLMTGASGLGKTKFASCLAAAMQAKLHTILCTPATATLDIGLAAREWQPFDFVFLDEAHALGSEVQEVIYPIMTNRMAPQVIDGQDGKRARVQGQRAVPEITILAATDRPGMLLNAFRKRFGKWVVFDPYEEDDMVKIARHVASGTGILLSPQAARFIAGRCRGVPRLAGQYLEQLRLFYADRATPIEFNLDDVRSFFSPQGVDELGRTKADQQYMAFLTGGPRSLQSLSLLLQLDDKYVLREMEPWLLRQGWIEVTRDGRCLTEAGRRVVNQASGGGE
jgi:Holliday junction DNA helicase RuvB